MKYQNNRRQQGFIVSSTIAFVGLIVASVTQRIEYGIFKQATIRLRSDTFKRYFEDFILKRQAL